MYIRFYRDSLAEPATDIYAFAYVSFNKEAGTWHTPAQPTRNYGSGTPMTTAATAPLRARAYERSATQARIQCLRRCPLLQQRRCAQHAVEHRVEYGVWAGIKLPGGQYRKREQLAAAHDVLRRIAGGEINSRQLPDNAALLARNEGLEVTPVPGVVVHLPIAQVGPQPAA